MVFFYRRLHVNLVFHHRLHGVSKTRELYIVVFYIFNFATNLSSLRICYMDVYLPRSDKTMSAFLAATIFFKKKTPSLNRGFWPITTCFWCFVSFCLCKWWDCCSRARVFCHINFTTKKISPPPDPHLESSKVKILSAICLTEWL